MESEMQSSSGNMELASDRGRRLELRKVPRKNQKKFREEKTMSAKQNLRSQDNITLESLTSQPYIDPQLSRKISENPLKKRMERKDTKEDELVKHMTNLPHYLQRMERSEDLQGKALNVGVLDWDLLEKWKQNNQSSVSTNQNASSFSSNTSFLTKNGSSTILRDDHCGPPHQNKQTTSLYSHTSTSHREGVKPSRRKVLSQSDLETSFRNSTDEKKKPVCTGNAGRNYAEKMVDKCNRKDINKQRTSSEMGLSSLHLRKHGALVSPTSKESNQNGENNKRVDGSKQSEFDPSQRSKSGESKNIVLLLPRASPHMNCSELSETKVVSDKKMVEVARSFSDANANSHLVVPFCQSHNSPRSLETLTRATPQKICSELSETKKASDKKMVEEAGKSFSDGVVNHGMELPSCPSHKSTCSLETPTRATPHKSCSELSETKTPADIKDTEENWKGFLDGMVHCMEFQSGASNESPYSIETPKKQLECKDTEENESNVKPTNFTSIENLNHIDQEKGRNNSPNRRLSVGLGRMSRSLSFREGFNVPKLSSTYATVKSGPVRVEPSPSLDNSRAKSSPLRRLLDPLLKPKGTSTHSSETSQTQPPRVNLSSFSVNSINSSGSTQDLTVEALLQLTVKNGLPLFKLVVDKSSDVLVATVKKITCGKDDSTWVYTFYSVCELKKKSASWISQGSKGKKCQYTYNVVAQMMASSSQTLDLTGKEVKEYLIEESVLFGVETKQSHNDIPELIPNRELAAIVVKVPDEGFISDGEQNDKQKAITVILPDGIHTIPKKGRPSSLIDRWRDGLCDCEGWDIGCKLRILTDRERCCNMSKQAKDFPNLDRFDLFVQGGGQGKRPIFSLAPYKKGIYSVDFDASISLLQALSICVAVINNDKSSYISEEASNLKPALSGNDSIKIATTTVTQSEAPTKYVPYPPLSPAGRV